MAGTLGEEVKENGAMAGGSYIHPTYYASVGGCNPGIDSRLAGEA